MMKNPVKAPPTCAIYAVLLGLKHDWPVTPEIKSKRMIPGIKYLTLMGMRMNISINSALGFIMRKAAKTAIIQLDAPTIDALKIGTACCKFETCAWVTHSSTLSVDTVGDIWPSVEPEFIKW